MFPYTKTPSPTALSKKQGLRKQQEISNITTEQKNLKQSKDIDHFFLPSIEGLQYGRSLLIQSKKNSRVD